MEACKRYKDFVRMVNRHENAWSQIPHKTVRQKQRPTWAQDHAKLIERVFGPRGMRRWKIACLYWLSGMTALAIAEQLGTTKSAVERVIFRLKHPRHGCSTA
jgi:hypothetical protein